MFALLQSTKTFLCTTAIVNFCLHYCNCQRFMEFTIANYNWSVKCFDWLLKAPLYLTTFFMHYCSWLLLFALFQLTTFVLTITTEDYCILQNDIKTSVTLIATAHINKKQHYSLYKTFYDLTLWLLELLSQLKMQNMTTKCSNVIHYNNSNNIHKLTTA